MRILSFFLAAVFAVSFATLAEAKRVALVIGNSNYQNAPMLPNPTNDAEAMAEKLRSLGFETVEGYDLDYDGMRTTLRKFARLSRNAEISTIFYAGHGIAVDGVNYLIPIDARLEDEVDWEFQVYNIEEFLRHVRHSQGASLIFLDACRNNPMADRLARSLGTSTRTVGGRGLAPLEISAGASGMAIAFATSPGETAADGDGEHSPFTSALLKYIGSPNTDITEVMSRVTGDVMKSTNRVQRPWINASLTGPVVLNPVDTEGLVAQPLKPQNEKATRGSDSTTTAAASIDVQKFMFEAATASNDPADFKAYLDTFPNGLFAQIARNAIRRIEVENAPVELPEPVETASVDPVQPLPEQTQAAVSAQPKTTQVIPQQIPVTPQQTAQVTRQQPTPVTPQQQQFAQVAPQNFNQLPQVAIPNQQQITATRSLAAPLSLIVTDALRSKLSNETTETMMTLSREQKREIQNRLNAAGFDVGYADGIFGKNTRRGVSDWQVKNGLFPTGYLNAVQHQLLTANTEAVYHAYIARQPVAAPVRKKTTKRATTKRKATKKRVAKKRRAVQKKRVVQKRVVRKPARNSAADAAVAGAILGLGVGLMLKKK